MTRTLIVFGDRTANEVLEAAQLACGEQFECIEKLYFEEQQFKAELVPRIQAQSSDVGYIVGAANESLKLQIVSLCDDLNWRAQSVIHPTAVVAPSASVGAGSFVAPLAVVSSEATVGRHSIVHIHASVGHDVVVGDYSAILPGARLSGKANIGNRTIVGSNAFVGAGLTIGDDCRVDALTYVQRDLPSGYIASVRSKHSVRRVEMRPQNESSELKREIE